MINGIVDLFHNNAVKYTVFLSDFQNIFNLNNHLVASLTSNLYIYIYIKLESPHSFQLVTKSEIQSFSFYVQ